MDKETTKKRNRRRRNKNKLNTDNCSETSSQNPPSNESFIFSSTSTAQLEAASPSKVSSTKVYQVRPGTISQGWEYEYKLAALLALRCVRYGIKYWWFASNPEGAGDFDDLVVYLKKPNGKDTTLLLQLKHKDDPKNVSQKDFLTLKGDFNLSKHFKTIVKLHQSMYSESSNLEIVKDLGAFSDINFIFFTNRKADYCEFLENHSDSCLSFLNTKTKAEMHRFNFTKLSLSDPIPDIVANCNLFLLSNQIHIDQTDTAIESEISKLSDTLKLSNVNIQDVAKGFSIHIRDWARGKLGGHYYFTKENVLCKLTELLLNQYTLNLIEKPFKKCINDKMHIWNQITANQVITVVDYSETVVNFLNEYICAEVQKHCESPMQSWGEKLSEKQKQSFYKNYPDLSENLLKNVGNRWNIRPLDIYKSLWRINKLPLLLVSNSENNKTIEGILKLSNNSYKVIVVQEFHKIEETHEREQEEEEEPTKSFKNLKDLNEEERNKILEQKVKLQGRPGAILRDIVNEKALQYITNKDILDILLGKFNIGNEIQEPVEYTIERTIIKRVVDREVLRNCDREIFLILGKLEEFLGEYTIFDINDIDLDNSRNIPGIINIHEATTSHQLEKLQKTKRPVHVCSAFDANYLDWIWSYGSRKTIEKHEVQLKYEVNQNYIARLLSTAAIVSDIPGMGKSVLTNYIAHHAPVSKWVLKVDLNAHQSYFRKKSTSSTDALVHLRYFYDTICCKTDGNSELSRFIFENFIKLKKIVILLDGFDEVAASLRNQVTNVAKFLHAKGYQVLVTTRPVMKQHLEETFKKSSISIMPFTRDHQRKYLTDFFISAYINSNVSTKARIQMFVEKLIKMVSENLNDMECEFMSIPLQSRLLAEVFSNECRQYISNTSSIDFNNDYDLLYLYDKFIENKIDVFVEKYKEVAYEQHERIRKYQALLAIKLVFPLDQIIEADTLKKVYQPFTDEPSLIQLLQREGIVIVDEKGNITCVHRTIAEFLAAEWLSDNLQNTNEEIKKFVHDLIIERFTRNYNFLFYIFDRILAQDCSLHLAIINKQIKVALDIINSDPGIVNVSDKGERSALHVVALNGLHTVYKSINDFVEDEMLSIVPELVRFEITTKTDMLGYTPLDYALASFSWQIANQLYKNMKFSVINIYIDLRYKKDYLQQFQNLNQRLLLNLLFYFASRDLLQNNIEIGTSLARYYSVDKSQLYEDKGFDGYNNFKTINNALSSKYGRTYFGYVDKGLFNSYYSDLRHAVVDDSTNNVKQLLQHGETEINKTDLDNNTLLHYAVLHGRSEIVKLLLDKNANFNKQNKDLNTPLHLSLSNCDIEITEMLLSKKINLHIVNKQGETALHLAFLSSKDNISNKSFLERQSVIVNLLLSKGVDINSENNSGETLLHYALKHGYPKNTINCLLSYKADINKMSYDGQAPLHFAVMKGDPDIVELLVMHGAHVNAVNKTGNAPLHIAVQKGQQDNVKILIAHGANLDKKDANGYTSLIVAAHNGHKEILNLIVENVTKNDNAMKDYHDIVKFFETNGPKENAQNAKGYAPLTWAASKGQNEIVKFLVTNGADVNPQNKYSYNTPLTCAAENGHDEIVKFLVANGADVNANSQTGHTPLFCAAKEGHDKTVKYLVAKGADVNAHGKYSYYSPLLCAAENGHVEIVKLLVANGADIYVYGKYSYNTPLICAIENGHDEIVKFLVANGAGVNAHKGDGYLPLIYAAKNGHDEIVKFLVANGADVNAHDSYRNTPLTCAIENGYDEMVKFFIANGADIHVHGEHDYTPLIYAVVNGHDEIVKFLVANGADVNPKDGYSCTPLTCASENGHDKIVKLLVANGADVNAKDGFGSTPLTCSTENGHDVIVKFLVTNGADVNAPGKYGSTPLTWAKGSCHEDTIKFLQENVAKEKT